jgi:RNA polymerase sigma-70 factor (ECF subfamily)
MAASVSNDMSSLASLLAEDAVLVSDGGGKRSAALRVLVGRSDIIRLLEGLAWRHERWADVRAVEPARINGSPGFIVHWGDGPQTFAFEPGPDGLIGAIYTVRNPDKLTHLSPTDSVAPA